MYFNPVLSQKTVKLLGIVAAHLVFLISIQAEARRRTPVPPLTISPSSVSLLTNGTQVFTAAGGGGSYIFSTSNGAINYSGNLGTYRAPASAGSSIVTVKDSAGRMASAQVAVTAPIPVIMPNSNWVKCADEYGICGFIGVASVHYGSANNFLTQTLAGPFLCGNGSFSYDPDIGANKSCYYDATTLVAPTPTPPPTPVPVPASSWVKCADEYGTCSFSGTANVRFGTDTVFSASQSVNGSVYCDVSVFGDPAVGANKYCSYDSASLVAAAPTPSPTITPTPTGGGTGSVSATFSSNTEDFLNPERGWYVNPNATELTNPATLLGFVQDWHTRQFMMREDLGAYKNQSLPQTYLDGLKARFAGARSAGIKLIVRFAYDWGGGSGDTTLNWVQTHTSQVAPILAANVDVISQIQAGFIGTWGEWAENSLIDSKANKRAVKDAVMAMAPAGIPVDFTQLYPPMEDWFAGQGPLTGTNAFSGSSQSRMGIHSDCFLTGTNGGDSFFYTGPNQVKDFVITSPKSQQRAYVATSAEYVPFGGELCVDSNGASQQLRKACSASYDFDGTQQPGGIMVEGPKYHLSYLGYPAYGVQPFKDSWIAGGCFDQVSRLMGYRFQLDGISHAQTISRGQSIDFNIDVRNLGWSRIFSARQFVVTLKNKNTGATIIGSAGDARLLPSQATSSTRIIVNVAIPSGASVGNYDVYVSMPDIYPSTANNPAYAVRFANSDNSSKGQAYDGNSALFKIGTVVSVQ